MYHHIRGELKELRPASAVVEAGGVGFELRIPLSTFDQLKGKKEVSLFTHLHVREDEHRLYGFGTAEERELFRLLISATGIGPAIAVGALSALSPGEVASGISSGDIKLLQRIRGVGRKLAERMVLELKDRVGPLLSALGIASPTMQAGADGKPATRDRAMGIPSVSDAVLALVSLGFDRKGAEDLVFEKHAELTARGAQPDAEVLIKEALRSGK